MARSTPTSGSCSSKNSRPPRSTTASTTRSWRSTAVTSTSRSSPACLSTSPETTKEAQAKFREIQNLTFGDPSLETLTKHLGVDVSGYALTTPVDEISELIDATGRAAQIVQRSKDAYGNPAPTLKEVGLFLRRGFGRKAAVGNPTEIADYLQEQFEERTVDGFVIFPPYLPGPLDAFVDLVIPELQRRNLFKKDYGTARTFRELFDLKKPENQFVARRDELASVSA